MANIKPTIVSNRGRFSGRAFKILKAIFVHYSKNNRDEYLVMQGIFCGVLLGATTTSFDHSVWFNVTCIVIAIVLFVFLPRAERWFKKDLSNLAFVPLLAVLIGDPLGPKGWSFTLILAAIGAVMFIVVRRPTKDSAEQPAKDV